MKVPFSTHEQYVQYLTGRIKHHIGVDDDTLGFNIIGAEIHCVEKGAGHIVPLRMLKSSVLAWEIAKGLEQWNKGVKRHGQAMGW